MESKSWGVLVCINGPVGWTCVTALNCDTLTSFILPARAYFSPCAHVKPEALSEAVRLLRASATAGCSGSNGAAVAQQVDHMARVIEQWVQSNGLSLL
jgi:hypothetical protein